MTANRGLSHHVRDRSLELGRFALVNPDQGVLIPGGHLGFI